MAEQARAPLVSVVIPTHNGGARVGVPLGALADQDAPPASFETIVVDNASTDGTAGIVERLPAARALATAGGGCRVVREPALGLTFARIRGAVEAKGEYICFLDDDNRPAADFVRQGLEAFRDAAVGLLTARVFPRYEVDPPASVRKREHLLAINDAMGDAAGDFGAAATLAPTLGAGMWVRRSAFLAAVPCAEPARLLCDRAGDALTSGGDIEIGYLIGQAGWQRRYWPGLVVWHEIPKTRLTTDYFTRLIVGVVRSKATLEAFYGGRRRSTARTARALVRLAGAILAAPLLVWRPDGVREARFVVIARWAELLGPYRIAR